MQNKDRIVDLSLGVAVWCAEGRIMDLQMIQRLSVTEPVAVKPGVGLNGSGIYTLIPR
jgi:hypothetical protein